MVVRHGRRFRNAPLRGLTVAVLLVGLVVTAVLTTSSHVSYVHNEQHLLTLQTNLTADALGVVQVDLERRLGQAAVAAADSPNPATSYRRAIASAMAPAGPFVAGSLELVKGGTVDTLVHVGAKSIESVTGHTATSLFQLAARSTNLITAHIVGNGQQRLAYLLAMPGTSGVFVAAASQALPSNRRLANTSGPDANLDLAIYFGPKATSAALIEASTSTLPLTGTTARAKVPFGNNVLLLVASPKTSLAGSWAQLTAWGILIVGILFSAGIALMTERLVRRRSRAEELAGEIDALYREQRGISETLQRSLLPKQLPDVEGVELAYRYIPGTTGVEIGGDWYSAIRVDDDRFAFVVGDVSGRGVAAATVMASLRYTIRAYASLGYAPAAILDMTTKELDVAVDHHFATALVGMVDNRQRVLTLASAGHFAPLIVENDIARFLPVPIGIPLGVTGPGYEELRLPIPAGATLVGFTDGLVERRGTSIDDGLANLLTLATSGPHDSVDGLLSRLLEVADPEAEDDIALLGMRWLE